MKPVIQIIQLLVIIQQLQNIRCQNYGEHEILRYFSLGNSEEQLDPDTGYSANLLANDGNNQAAASLNLQQYQVTEDFENLDELSRADYARTKKLFRIKNPFQKQSEGNQEAETNNNQNTNQNDNNIGASNQYSSLHFSLPSDDYIQKLRAENQYYQQQQSTPSPNTGYEYTATPVPQYQFSTIPSGNYDNNNQQSNQIQFDSKISQSQNFNPNANNYQYTTSNPYQAENIATTSYPYIQTSIPNNNQFVGTGSNPYFSSSLPLYLTSPQNMQSYISSPYSQTTIQSASPEYNNNNNRGSSTIGNNLESYDKNDQNKNMQVEYYDNSVNGVKYPLQQYQNEYQATTLAPVSSPYNAGINALSKSLQELSLSQLQNFAYPQNQQDYRSDGSVDISENQNTHRAGSYPASNPYLKYMQQEYQNQNNRPQDEGQETNQRDYPNGDFSWKLGTKKVSPTFEAYPDNNIKTYHPSQSGGDAISQISFNMETGKQNNYDQISKATSKNTEGQDFIKSVGNSLENIKQSQQYSVFNNNQQSQSTALTNNVFQNNAENQRSKYNENTIFSFGNNQHDLVTASPTYNFNPKEVSNERPNSLFDHAKALKAIVPIDMSNVGNSESQGKNNGYDGKTRFNLINFNQDQPDAIYKDKNSMYGFNIKTKPENFVTSENFKQFEQSAPFFSKKQQSLDITQNMPINFAGVSSSFSFNSHPEGQQSHNNQQTAHRFQAPSELSTFKVNDGPYRFAQEITSDNFRLNGNNLEQNGVPFHLPERINQNINSHQLDMLTGLSNKYSANKQHGISFGRPESEAFAGAISTINGFKVANPFNVDMKLVADVLKGKHTVDETHLLPFRDQFNKALPSRLEFSQLQHLLKNGNTGNFGALNDGISSFTNKYFEPYNGRYPPPGVKYSRSQEEEEHIPITDTGSNPFIGAVIDQDDTHGDTESRNTIRDAIALDEENITPVTLNEEKQKKAVSHRIPGEKHRHRNSIGSARYPFLRKYPRANGPHSLLKPPPFNRPRNRMTNNKMEPLIRKRRLNKPSAIKILMKESDFGTAPSSEGDDSPVSILLRPPPQTAEARSDNVTDKPSS